MNLFDERVIAVVHAAMFAIGYLELGNMTAAAEYFSRAYQTQKPPFMVFFEGIGGGTPNFITGAGNFNTVMNLLHFRFLMMLLSHPFQADFCSLLCLGTLASAYDPMACSSNPNFPLTSVK